MNNMTFIDLFAGCGGMSLGLMQAGWKGHFAVEKDSMAFSTLEENLVADGSKYKFGWPKKWLPIGPHNIIELLEKRPSRKNIEALKGQITLVVGGPPCQGFSMAGRRKKNDRRNKLYKHYIEFIALVKPTFVIIENVRGIGIHFGGKPSIKRKPGRPRLSYAEKIEKDMKDIGYAVKWFDVRAVDYGVPQLRPRHIMLGINRQAFGDGKPEVMIEKFGELLVSRHEQDKFLESKGLEPRKQVTAKEAISDLETARAELEPCKDKESPLGFSQIVYKAPNKIPYQELMRPGMNGEAPNSLRLARHEKKTTDRFAKIIDICEKNKSKGTVLSEKIREQLGTKKHSIVVLNENQPSHTITTLPDDIIHYSEPRILTVRECARLQSFPDWFEFRGKYTTGGDRRTKECPRYTQVGNAVPPLLAEAIGKMLIKIHQGL